jgi:hypothetical protein
LEKAQIGNPLIVSCLPPLTPVIVATVPLIPVTVGFAEVVVMAGHSAAQGPMQALTPEFAVSSSHT